MKKTDKKIINIMVVDDHPVLRQGLKMIIEREENFVVCAEASNASDAVKLINDHKPEVVLVDIVLEGSANGIELIKAIKDRYPGVISLVLSMYDASLFAERAIRAGASGYIMKKEAGMNITNAIKTVMEGKLYLSAGLSTDIVKKLLHGSSDIEPENVLTDRELEIFIMIGNGTGIKEIAANLNLSGSTVETHRRHIREKMQYKDLNDLVKNAVQWVFSHNK